MKAIFILALCVIVILVVLPILGIDGDNLINVVESGANAACNVSQNCTW